MLQNDDPPSGDTNKTCCRRSSGKLRLTTFGTLFGSPLYYSLTGSFFDFFLICQCCGHSLAHRQHWSGPISPLAELGAGSRAAAFEPQQYPGRRQTLLWPYQVRSDILVVVSSTRGGARYIRVVVFVVTFRTCACCNFFSLAIGSTAEQEKQYSKD
jgi:hypothetical protein